MSQIGTVEEPAVRTAVPEGSLQGAPPAVRAPMGGPFQERLGGGSLGQDSPRPISEPRRRMKVEQPPRPGVLLYICGFGSPTSE